MVSSCHDILREIFRTACTCIYIVTTLHVPHFLAVPPGSVEVEPEVVSGEGPVEAGSGGPTLTCTVRETISGLINMPSALWMGPSGPVEDRESVTLTGIISDVTATLTLTFPSLLTSEAGEYTCQGTVVGTGHTSRSG